MGGYMADKDKQKRKSFRLLLPDNVHEWVSIRSQLNDRTINAEILQIIKAQMGKSSVNPIETGV